METDIRLHLDGKTLLPWHRGTNGRHAASILTQAPDLWPNRFDANAATVHENFEVKFYEQAPSMVILNSSMIMYQFLVDDAVRYPNFTWLEFVFNGRVWVLEYRVHPANPSIPVSSDLYMAASVGR